MKKLDEEQLESVMDYFTHPYGKKGMTEHLKEKGLIKEEFEVGKWYKAINSQALCFIVSFPNRGIKDECEVYGFDISGDWIGGENCYGSITNEFRKATDKEVEDALIKEAKKREFKEGVKYISLTTGDNVLINFKEHDDFAKDFYGSIYNNQLCACHGTIFMGGKWAEIIEEKKEIVVNGVTYIEK